MTARKILIATQFSPLSNLVISSPWEGDVIEPAHYVDDDGNRHPTSGWVPGGPPSGRRWVPARREQLPGRPTFAELCEQFPAAVSDDTGRPPAWGSGHYVADENGYPVCIRSNWDTSD